MSDFTGLTTILLLGLVFGFIARFAINNMLKHIEKIEKIIANDKEYRAKEAQVALMKANGDFHEWRSFADGAGGDIMVCIKTGWAPKLQGFIPMERINKTLEELKVAEEYKIFRAAAIQQLAHTHQMTVERMEQLVESVFDIKKQFHLNRMVSLSNSMKQRAEDVKKGNPF